MEVSIIIRIRNEVENLQKLLSILAKQTFQDFEVVVVDDHSTDGSELVASQFFSEDKGRTLALDRKFTYPYACNFGARHARGKYLVYLSAHSFPFSNTWLADGLSNFKNEKVAGVFAFPVANPKTNFFEKLYMNWYAYLFQSRKRIYTQPKMGVSGFTNAIVRKDLWEQRQFNEDYIKGGEDFEWASFWLAQGLIFIQDPKFRVYHSHNLYPLGLLKQAFKYLRTLKPSPEEKAKV